MCCRLASCCCGCSLRTGTLVIGILELIFSLFILLSTAIAAWGLSPVPDYIVAIGGGRIYGYWEMVVGICIALAVASAIVVITDILLFIGIAQNKAGFLLPWIVFESIYTILNTILVIVYSSYNISLDYYIGFGITGMSYSILNLLIRWYCLSVVYSLYKTITEQAKVPQIEDEPYPVYPDLTPYQPQPYPHMMGPNQIMLQPSPSMIGPSHNMQKPYPDMAGPNQNMPRPYSYTAGPNQNMPSPHASMEGPYQNFQKPYPSMADPNQNIQRPYASMDGPYQSMHKPYPNMAGPNQSMPRPNANMAGPNQSIPRPYANTAGPNQSMPRPYANMAGPNQSIPRPYSNTAGPIQNIQQQYPYQRQLSSDTKNVNRY